MTGDLLERRQIIQRMNCGETLNVKYTRNCCSFTADIFQIVQKIQGPLFIVKISFLRPHFYNCAFLLQF